MTDCGRQSRRHELIKQKQLQAGTTEKVNPPISSQVGRVTKVTTLCLTSIRANHITIEAILAKYQCTELILPLVTRDNLHVLKSAGRDFGIAPETFSKQTALEVLSLFEDHAFPSNSDLVCQWLRQVLSHCKSLKTFKLNFFLRKSGMLCLFKNLPTSLEKLFIPDTYSDDSVIELLAKNHPNLKELELSPEKVKYPSLLKFQFLEVLHFTMETAGTLDFVSLCKYLIKFPALKFIYLWLNFDADWHEKRYLDRFRTKLEAHNISFSIRTVKRELGPAPEGINR